VADENEQVQPFAGGQLLLITIFGDFDPAYQFHHEVGPAIFGSASIENLRDVRMVHHRQRLTFGFEASDDLP